MIFVLYLILTLGALVINALVIIGAFDAANDVDGKGNHMILYKPKMLFEKLLGEYWSKPVLGCYKCMASLWGGVPSLVLFLTLSTSVTTVFLSFVGAFLYTCALSATVNYIYEDKRKNTNVANTYYWRRDVAEVESKKLK